MDPAPWTLGELTTALQARVKRDNQRDAALFSLLCNLNGVRKKPSDFLPDPDRRSVKEKIAELTTVLAPKSGKGLPP